MSVEKGILYGYIDTNKLYIFYNCKVYLLLRIKKYITNTKKLFKLKNTIILSMHNLIL